LLVLVLPLAIGALSVSRSGPLPAPTLPPSFDVQAATAVATELAHTYPNRVPGGSSDDDAAEWFARTLAQYGLTADSDVWHEHVPGLGDVRLRNVAVVVPGVARSAIVFAAHRDTNGVGAGANDDATGTAALIQLARAYAAVAGGTRPKPAHTLIFLSTDAGAWGGLGARRFVTHSPFRHDVLAAVALDGLAGTATPRIDVSGDGGRSPAPALVRTALARVREQVRASPELTGTLGQLVDLGLPLGLGDQAPFLGAHVSALRLTTTGDGGHGDVGDVVGRLDRVRFAQLGAASQNLLGSLDAAGELAQGTAPTLYLRGRAVRGWALDLVLVALLIPFLVGLFDLIARVRRHGVELAPAFRALRRRLGFWAFAGALVWFGAQVGFLPAGSERPLAPNTRPASDWPLSGLAVLGGLGLAAWFVSRRRLVPSRPATRGDELGGYAAALAGLGVLAIVVAAVNPLALAFLVPSLYAWLWLPQTPTRAWVRDVVFGTGLAGALLVLLAVGARLELGARTPLYLVELVTVGYVPWTTFALALAWTAIACQLGTLTVGRYGPYAGGARRPPRGALRETVRRTVVALQSRRR
jgi:hypothetical protein